MLTISNNPTRKGLSVFRPNVIKFLGFNPGACPWDEAKKYFSKSLMSISSEYNRSNSIKGTFNYKIYAIKSGKNHIL